ncbi:MAG: hypothetical protein SOW66_01895 [Porphyromonas sp.]|nr:hypothetical protein [Porphyromonas sp.]
MNFKTAFVLSLGLAIGGGLASCSDELSDRSAKTEESQQAKPNAELSLSADFGLTQEEEFASTENPRSFTLQVGRGGRNRPHILIKENDEIPAHLIFAYTDTDGSGNPIGTPTVIADKPVAVTLKAKLPKDVGQDDNYWGLEALKQPINIPQIESLQNKAWFVMGVVGANWNATDKRLEFDPNSVLFDPAVKLEEGMTRKAGVPHTFAWKRIYFQKAGSMMRTSIDGVRFKPRGLFVRMNLQNVSGNGLYVPQRLQFPAGQGYSPKTSLKLTATLDDLKSTTEKHAGFDDLSGGKPTYYEFPRELKDVTFTTADGEASVTRKIYDYKYYLGTMVETHPYIVNPQAEIPFFWLWVGDVQANAETLVAEVHGESLGTLVNTHKFTFTNMAIPAGKPGYTVARTGNIKKFRPLLPLEFVARGNLSRLGFGNWKASETPTVPEVGPSYGYPGGSVRGLWNGGGTFSYAEVIDWNRGSKTMSLKPAFRAYNRYLPSLEEWRAAVPIFRNRYGYDNEVKPTSDVESGYYTAPNYIDRFKGDDVIGNNQTYQLFGAFSSGATQVAPITGRRNEWMRFPDTNNDGKAVEYGAIVSRQAIYTRVNTDEIIGVRFINTSGANDEERRLHFAAYRLKFSNYTGNKANTGGLTVQCVYIGNERLDASASVAEDENAWAIEVLDPMWWAKKEQESEVIERVFPLLGFANAGGGLAGGNTSEQDYARYMVDNCWYHTGDFLAFAVHKYGHNVSIETARRPQYPVDTWQTGDLAIRYFVIEPRRAFEQWGSRN